MVAPGVGTQASTGPRGPGCVSYGLKLARFLFGNSARETIRIVLVRVVQLPISLVRRLEPQLNLFPEGPSGAVGRLN